MKFQRLLYDALIVPSAHTRVFDGKFQLELYEVFHTRAGTRWMHRLCTPIVNVSLLAAATRLPLPFNGAAVSVLISLPLYFMVHGAWAAVMIPILAIAFVLAHALAAFLGPSVVPAALGMAYAAAFVQTLSHALEPVPPPWSGSYRWITLREFLFRTPPLKLLGLSGIAILIFPILEFWASPRIWPVQLKPAQAPQISNRVRDILSDARKGWSLPPL